jgi:LytS/YehU family sensor histidine kinase
MHGPWHRDGLIVAAFNTAIAVLFATMLKQGFAQSFIYSQAIGLSIFGCTRVLIQWRGIYKPDWRTMAVAVPVGSAVGTTIGYFLVPALIGEQKDAAGLLPGSLVGSLIFGVAISYFFYSRVTIAEKEAALQQSARDAAEAERRRAEAELKALQAQIEPHFLFNTLSNVAGLIDSDPATAKRMLTSFTGYLRGSLDRTRAGGGTVGQELEMVRRYLEIMAIRMGDRLRWVIDLPDELAAAALPPLTLQPFVENALQHGLGPRPEGGEIRIVVWRDGHDLVIDVIDTGVGLDTSAVPGVGIANVRARLAALHGARSDVVLAPVVPHGVRATVRVPA